MNDQAAEPIIEPDLPIVDAHHHLWFLPEATLAELDNDSSIVGRLAPVYRRKSRYLLDELLADMNTGHNVRATVFVDAHAMYRTRGPEAMKSVGEVEFVNGVAAMAASGLFGDVAACAGIVGGIDLRLGAAIEPVLNAHVRAGGGRYCGVRSAVIYDEDGTILGPGSAAHVLLDPAFRAGFKCLGQRGLSFDALVLEPQLPELIDLARTFPKTSIILNHVGAPVGVGRYQGQRLDRFATWRDNIKLLSRSPNVFVKLGGLGIPVGGFEYEEEQSEMPLSLRLAMQWAPYIETCVDAFGVKRCMFESNFPVDAGVCSYPILWNAFKRSVSGASTEEKEALFYGTATRVYKLAI